MANRSKRTKIQDGRGGQSLQSVGNAFGLTRERVRQIVKRASARLQTGQTAPRALDRTIAYVADQVPSVGVIDAGGIEAEIRSKGLTGGLFRLRCGSQTASRCLGCLRHEPYGQCSRLCARRPLAGSIGRVVLVR
jgi:hypothetical protein